MMSRAARQYQRCLLHRSDGFAQGPDVSMRVGQANFTPAVGIILRWLQNNCARASGALLDCVGIDAEEAEFSSTPAQAGFLQSQIGWMVIVSVVRVKHEGPTVKLECREVSIGIANLHAYDVLIKPDRVFHISHQQIHGKLWHSPAIITRGHEGITRSRSGHA